MRDVRCGVERRRLGRTEHESSVAILGGAAFWATSSPEEARPSFELALDAGVNHLDIAPQYGNAERVVGPLVPEVRDRLFVAGKTLRSNPDGVEAQFDDTRRLLGCEVLEGAGNFVTFRPPDAVALADALLRRGLVLRAYDAGIMAGWLRATARLEPEEGRPLDALKEVMS